MSGRVGKCESEWEGEWEGVRVSGRVGVRRKSGNEGVSEWELDLEGGMRGWLCQTCFLLHACTHARTHSLFPQAAARHNMAAAKAAISPSEVTVMMVVVVCVYPGGR